MIFGKNVFSWLMQNDLYNIAFEKNRIDYSAVTVGNGRILRRRIYYKCEDIRLPDIGIEYFDRALSSGDMLCFSIGFDRSFCIKYDFSLRKTNLTSLYEYLSSEYIYFDMQKIKDVSDFFTSQDIIFDNHVLGIRRYTDSSSGRIGICPYFRVGRSEFDRDRCAEVIRELTSLFFEKPMTVYIPQNHNCRLHMIALDFTHVEFKLKIYFEFDAPFERIDTPLVDICDPNFNVIDKSVKCEENLEFFQIAMNKHGVTTYNLYFKPCL